MTLIAICSGKGSPGVSTLACVAGAVWPSDRRIVVAECDPSGNDLAVRFGMSQRVGITSLVLAHRHSEHPKLTFDDHIQTLPGGLETLVGPVNADAAMSLDRQVGAVGVTIFPGETDIVADCGRILANAPGQQAILSAADEVVVVTRSDAAGMAHTLWTLDVVRSLSCSGSNSIVIVGQGEFRAEEIEKAFHATILGSIPRDGRSAAVACGAPGKSNRFARSGLVSSVRLIVDRLSAKHSSESDSPQRRVREALNVVENPFASTLADRRFNGSDLGEPGAGLSR